jgi:hypothetical protein
VLAGLVGGCLLAAPGSASAAGCAAGGGVTVVVDFRALGGEVRTGCAGGDPASGLTALGGAGFGYTFASRQPGFVCRIDNRPGPDTEQCVNTPPTSAYWSYWHAAPGGSWTSSSIGAGGYDPAPGSVEGWAFGAGRPPSVTPPAPPAPKPPPPPAPGPGAPPPPAQQAIPGGPVPGVVPPPVPPLTPPQPSRGPSVSMPTASVGSVPTSDSPQATEDPVEAAHTEATDFTGLLVGGVVIAVVAALGFWTARRRARDR